MGLDLRRLQIFTDCTMSLSRGPFKTKIRCNFALRLFLLRCLWGVFVQILVDWAVPKGNTAFQLKHLAWRHIWVKVAGFSKHISMILKCFYKVVARAKQNSIWNSPFIHRKLGSVRSRKLFSFWSDPLYRNWKSGMMHHNSIRMVSQLNQ